MAGTSNLSVNLDVSKRLDISCRKGDTFSLVISATDSAGDPIDFGAYTDMLIQVRPTDEDTGTPVLEFLWPANFNVATVGQVAAEQDAATMAAVTAGTYVYDFQMTDAGGNVATWFYGLFTIIDDVSF